MAAERLELQELQHGRIKRLGNAIDFVKEQDAGFAAGRLHVVVHGRDDLAHRVFGDIELAVFVSAMHDRGQAERALAGVVRHGVGDKADAQLAGDLGHDGRFADARCAHKEQWALLGHVKQRIARLILCEISLHGVFHVLFCLCDIHAFVSPSGWAGKGWSRPAHLPD